MLNREFLQSNWIELDYFSEGLKRSMGILHDELRRVMHERWTHTELLRCVLRNRGVTVTDEDFDALAESMTRGENSVHLTCDGPGDPIEITDEDLERARHELESKYEAGAESAVTRVVGELAPGILGTLYDTMPQALKEWRAADRAFEKRLYDQWREGLDRLEMLITMAYEAGEMYLSDLRNGSADDEPPPEPVLLNVLAALHCRACRTAREILCLLKAGYADGAHARWRSLHELVVIAYFLLEHPVDTPQRYLDHAIVERFRAAMQYQLHCKTLGDDPLSEEEVEGLKKASDAVIAKYGSPFREDYGWAAEALHNQKPNFTQIEESLEMAHWRPWFRLACQSVHAGSQGLYFALGLPLDEPGMLLAGASDAGLTDPGHQMAISLSMVTVAFLTAHPNLDGLVSCHCIFRVCDDIGEVLLRAHEARDTADATSEPS